METKKRKRISKVDSALKRLNVGQKIHYSTSKDAIKRLEDGIVTNAVIYKRDGDFGVNINKTLVDMGMAERDEKDKTANVTIFPSKLLTIPCFVSKLLLKYCYIS